jgi:gas vesicle protein
MRFLMGFIIGLILGAVVVLLTTPQSGRDLQRGVRSRIDEIVAAGRQAAASRRAELEARLAELRAG